MILSVKIALLFSGLFLLLGMVTGIWKYAKMSAAPDGVAPVYVDIAHRASFFYSFASLVIAALVSQTPFSGAVQLAATAFPLVYFTLTLIGYVREGMLERTDNMFRSPSLVPRWFMYSLIAGEIGGLVVILAGFAYAQFLQN